mgnify:CR=1 FL=1
MSIWQDLLGFGRISKLGQIHNCNWKCQSEPHQYLLSRSIAKSAVTITSIDTQMQFSSRGHGAGVLWGKALDSVSGRRRGVRMGVSPQQGREVMGTGSGSESIGESDT